MSAQARAKGTHAPDGGCDSGLSPNAANRRDGDSGVSALLSLRCGVLRRSSLVDRSVSSPLSDPSSCCIVSRIFPIALSGLLTDSVIWLPVRWKKRFVLSNAGKDMESVRGLAGSSPGVEGEKGDMSVGASGRICRVGDGGSSCIAISTFFSNSSCVMLLKLDASMVSMKAIAPV